MPMRFSFLTLGLYLFLFSTLTKGDCLQTEVDQLLLDRTNEWYANKAGLHYTSSEDQGYTRKIDKSSTKYYDGKRLVKDPKTIDYLDSLRVPMDRAEVWYSKNRKSHVLAKSIDQRGRSQYVYHPKWIEIRSNYKYIRSAAFGLMLPSMRKIYVRNTKSKSLDSDAIHSTIMWLMDLTSIRIGNEIYASENETFGLTTLKKDHVQISGSQVRFQFIGKSGKDHSIEISNTFLASKLRSLLKSPGKSLFQFQKDQKWQSVDSASLNRYLKSISTDHFSAKDYRTWNANVRALTYSKNKGHPNPKRNELRE